MSSYTLRNGDKYFTLTGIELYYLVAALEALIEGYQPQDNEIREATQILSKYELMLGLEQVPDA